MLSRRHLLTFALMAPWISRGYAAPAPQRLAVLDWGLTELALAMGETPMAVSAPDWYRKLIHEPPLPPGVVDIGLLFQPNIETLYALHPDLIVITAGHGLLKPTLEKVAPTLTLPTQGLSGYRKAAAMLGQVLNRHSQAAAVIDHLQQTMTQTRAHTVAFTRPVFLAAPLDPLHMKLYGPGSLFGDVMTGCGITNAWQGSVNPQGEALVELPRIGASTAGLILLPAAEQMDALRQWQASPLWQRLPLTRQRDIWLSPTEFSASGALITASRFAATLDSVISEWTHD